MEFGGALACLSGDLSFLIFLISGVERVLSCAWDVVAKAGMLVYALVLQITGLYLHGIWVGTLINSICISFISFSASQAEVLIEVVLEETFLVKTKEKPHTECTLQTP